jgi:CBS domain-containing protein
MLQGRLDYSKDAIVRTVMGYNPKMYYTICPVTRLMSFESIPVSSIMTKNVIVQTEDQTIQAISRTMYENNIGNVPIARNSVAKSSIENQNRIVGIITERDVVRIVGSFDQTLYNMPVRELMSKPIISITPAGSLKDAIETMQLKNIRRLPVIEPDGNLVGMITSRDIFKIITKNQDTVSTFINSNLVPHSDKLFERFSQYWSEDILNKRP